MTLLTDSEQHQFFFTQFYIIILVLRFPHRLVAIDELSGQIRQELITMKSSYSDQLDKLNRKIKTHYQFLDSQDEMMEQMLYTIESCYSKQVTVILLLIFLCQPLN